MSGQPIHRREFLIQSSRQTGLALAAGLAAGAQLKCRPLRESEKRFAAPVFGTTLPVDRIRVTNLDRGGR